MWKKRVSRSPYDSPFSEGRRTRTALSARAIVPHIVTLVEPSSVIDVGCGEGAWLSVFREWNPRRAWH